MRVAVCDLGSFSALILIVDGDLRALHEERLTVDLTQDPGTNEIGRPALSRALRAMNRFRHLVARYKCEGVAVVTTAAIRDAANRDGVLHALNGHSPVPIQVLSHVSEGRLAAEGAVTGLGIDPTNAIVIDLGGGSTEIVARPNFVCGISTGAARATQQWISDLPQRPGARHQYLMDRAREAMSRLSSHRAPNRESTIAVGGTITTLAAMNAEMRQFDTERIHGMTLTTSWISKEARRLSMLDPRALERQLPFVPERARVLVAGTYLWLAVLERLSVGRVFVSARGLCWGVAARLIGTMPSHKTP